MNVIIVDDDVSCLRLLEGFCSMIPYVNVTGAFCSATEACHFAEQNPPELALLDIMMPIQDGFLLCDCLREISPDINVIFMTSCLHFALPAFQRHAVAYITKPFSFSDIYDAFERAKRFCHSSQATVFARAFGHFDLFLNNEVLVFPRQKCKELLAYLIDRKGGAVTMEQIIDVLWEDRCYDETIRSYFYVILRDLKKMLKDAGIDYILSCNRNQNAIDPSKFSCDYYHFLAGDKAAFNCYSDEYMVDYSWAEPTAAFLTQKKLDLSNIC